MRVHLIAVAALVASLTTACQSTTTSPGGGKEPPRAPTNDRSVCPPEAQAAQVSEPLPPAGISSAAVVGALVEALGEEKALAFWRWLTVEYPGWARDNFGRLKVVRARCKAAEQGAGQTPPDS